MSVPVWSTLLKTVEVPQLQFIDKVVVRAGYRQGVDVPVIMQRQVEWCSSAGIADMAVVRVFFRILRHFSDSSSRS